MKLFKYAIPAILVGLFTAGIVWAVNVTVPQATQKGDTLTGKTNGNYILLHPGSDGTVLTASSTSVNGLIWGTAGGGGTWGSITGTLSAQTDLQATLDAKLSTTTAASTYYLQSNPANYIDASALSPYLTLATAASTYQPIGSYLTAETDPIWLSQKSAYLTTTTAASTYYLQSNPSSYITASALSPYLTSATAASTYYLQTNPASYITASALTPYLTTTTAASTYQPIITVLPVINGGTGSTSLNTTLVAEGTNLYYLDSRARGAISLTTTGTSGAATYNNSTGAFNIPNYATGGGGVWGSITGTLSSQTDLQTALNAKLSTTSASTTYVPLTRNVNTNSPLQGGGALSGDLTISMPQASTTGSGYLSSTDWNTFNGKQNSGAYLTSVTSDSPLSGAGTSASHLVFTNPGYLLTVSTTSPIGGDGTLAHPLTFTNPGYISANQSISLSGDVSGTGATAISTAIGNNKITPNMVLSTGQVNGYCLTFVTGPAWAWATCGTGGSGATTTINSLNGPTFTFATTSGTGFDLKITNDGAHTFTWNIQPAADYGMVLTASSTAWNNTTNTVTASSSNWTTAFNQTLQWNGGSTNLVATTGRTSLGLGDSATLASTTWFKVGNNLSEGTATTMRTNLGLGGLAVLGVPSAGIVTSNGSALSNITDSSANWNTAYTQTERWNGGSTDLVAATGRTSLGLGTMALLANTGSTTITTLGTITTGTWNGGVIPILYGGTGTTTPGLIQGANITITGTWPFQTITGSAGGSGNSAWTIGNGLIYNATSTDLVGIGTITPTTTLFVQGKSGTNPFVIASSTGTQMMTVLQNGNVGIGTTSPSQLLTVGNNNQFTVTSAGAVTNTGETVNGSVTISGGSLTFQYASPAFITSSNTSSGSNMVLQGPGAANSFLTLRSVNHLPASHYGSTDYINFIVGNGSDTANTEAIRIISGGNVGIGTTTPSYKLVVAGTIQQASSTNCSLGIVTDVNGVFNGCVASSRTLKRNIKDYVYNSSIIDQLQPVTYYWKDPNRGSGEKIGFIADDVKKVLPQAAVSGGDNLLAVDPNGILAVVVSELQNVRQSIIALFNRVGDLASKLQIDENKIAAQQNQINNLQKQVNLLLQIEAKGK